MCVVSGEKGGCGKIFQFGMRMVDSVSANSVGAGG